MVAKLYTVSDIAKELGIKSTRAAYIIRLLIEEKKIIPVVDNRSVRLFDKDTLKQAKAKNLKVRE